MPGQQHTEAVPREFGDADGVRVVNKEVEDGTSRSALAEGRLETVAFALAAIGADCSFEYLRGVGEFGVGDVAAKAVAAPQPNR
jgi:hypothetical protein